MQQRQRQLLARLRPYGLSVEVFNQMGFAQKHACLICSSPDELVIDHCHKTMLVRGLLCSPCNTGLGKFQDDVFALEYTAEMVADGRMSWAPGVGHFQHDPGNLKRAAEYVRLWASPRRPAEPLGSDWYMVYVGTEPDYSEWRDRELRKHEIISRVITTRR